MSSNIHSLFATYFFHLLHWLLLPVQVQVVDPFQVGRHLLVAHCLLDARDQLISWMDARLMDEEFRRQNLSSRPSPETLRSHVSLHAEGLAFGHC